jgi:hypothetical protein
MGMQLPAMVIMGALMDRQRQAQARKQAAANILQQSAAAQGAPTYNVQGASAQNQISNAPSSVANILRAYAVKNMNQPGGGSAMAQAAPQRVGPGGIIDPWGDEDEDDDLIDPWGRGA